VTVTKEAPNYSLD